MVVFALVHWVLAALVTLAYERSITNEDVTAGEQGYRHILDIDQSTLAELHTDICRLGHEEGYKLGQPRDIWPEKGKEQDRDGTNRCQDHSKKTYNSISLFYCP